MLFLDGEDLRDRPLVERKRVPRRLVGQRGGRVRYLHHVARRGVDFFRLVCEQDLEGIPPRRRGSPWIKVKNRDYS